jgi:hypothetical protein
LQATQAVKIKFEIVKKSSSNVKSEALQEPEGIILKKKQGHYIHANSRNKLTKLDCLTLQDVYSTSTHTVNIYRYNTIEANENTGEIPTTSKFFSLYRELLHLY